MDVRKELSFCAKTKLRVLGVVENMSGLLAPLSAVQLRDAAGADVSEWARALIAERCPELLQLHVGYEVFPSARGGAEAMAASFGAPFLGRVPLEPALTRACEAGTAYATGARAAGRPNVLAPIVERLLEATGMAGAAPPGKMEE